MRISKILFFEIVCPQCGTKITLSAEEYNKYIKETEDYYGSKIICTEKLPGEEQEVECERYFMSCPSCSEAIELNLTPIDAEKYGFNLPSNVKPFYEPSYELSMEDYLKKFFNEDEEEEKND